jgi:hypothetical protein
MRKYKKLTVDNKYYVPCLFGPPIIFGLINNSFLIGLLTLVIGFIATHLFLKLSYIIGGEKIYNHFYGPRMNVVVMVTIFIWVGIFLPKFFS